MVVGRGQVRYVQADIPFFAALRMTGWGLLPNPGTTHSDKMPDPNSESARLTVPDLVVLALLSERPMHGYALNAELEWREARDWAGISRPQVYYSLRKLAAEGFIEEAEGEGEEDGQPPGPERRTYRPTEKGTRALADALERESWSQQRPPPAFLTWMALSSHARPGVVRTQVARRRAFLEQELAKERATLADLEGAAGHDLRAPVLMVKLTLRHFEAELAWLDEVDAAFADDPPGDV
jgi:DNA-binding PadR family transcriptional regulator